MIELSKTDGMLCQQAMVHQARTLESRLKAHDHNGVRQDCQYSPQPRAVTAIFGITCLQSSVVNHSIINISHINVVNIEHQEASS